MEMPEVVEELTKCAEIAYNNDVRMQEIRDEISRKKSSQNLTVNPVDEESIEHML
jgi:ppGpp synthetase/RelA/SpoT-type nucleotidyltranferase